MIILVKDKPASQWFESICKMLKINEGKNVPKILNWEEFRTREYLVCLLHTSEVNKKCKN